MAREVIVRVVDDFDNSEDADTTRVLGWDGYDYVLDLTDKNDQELQELLQPYLDVAHEKRKQKKQAKTTADPGSSRPGPKPSRISPEERRTIRAWARAQGMQVGDKGLIARSIIEAYENSKPDE